MINAIGIEKELSDIFLYDLTKILGTMFTIPEINIVEEGEKSDCMYFIMTGECLIFINDF